MLSKSETDDKIFKSRRYFANQTRFRDCYKTPEILRQSTHTYREREEREKRDTERERREREREERERERESTYSLLE